MGGVGQPEGRIRFEVTGGAVGVVGLAVVGLFFWLLDGGDLPLAAGTSMIVAVLVDAWLARRTVKRGRVRLEAPELMEAGRASTWRAAVEGCPRPASLHLLLLGTDRDVLAVDHRSGTLVIPPLPRGVVPFVVLDLTARGPLGLIGAGRRLVVHFDRGLPIVPVALEHAERWPQVRARSFGTNEGAPVGDDLFRTVRPYRYGDERRRVDWKATAHHGELMVRESDGLGIVRVRLVVDLGRPGEVAEAVAGIALWLCGEAMRRGWSVELVTLDAGGSVPALRSIGRTFGPPPEIVPAPIVALPTISAPVRSRADVGRRLATTAFGTPASVAEVGRGDLSCRISPAGVVWS